MHKEELQNLLDRFGYTVTLNKKIGGSCQTHMHHVAKEGKRLVDYTIDDVKNVVKAVWAYTETNLSYFETTEELKTWLEL